MAAGRLALEDLAEAHAWGASGPTNPDLVGRKAGKNSVTDG